MPGPMEDRFLEILKERALTTSDGIVGVGYSTIAQTLSQEGIPAQAGQIHDLILDLKARGLVSAEGGGMIAPTLATLRIPGLLTSKEEELVRLIKSSLAAEPASCQISYEKTGAVLKIPAGIVQSMMIHLRAEKRIAIGAMGQDAAVGVRLV